MTSTNPCDYLPLKTWFYEYGKEVFGSDKMLHYHTKPIQKELIEAGGMAKVGVHIYLHKTRFWPEYQRIIANNLSGCDEAAKGARRGAAVVMVNVIERGLDAIRADRGR